MAYAYIPRRRKPRQEDCHKFKANLGYIVSSRSACYVERHSVLTTEGQWILSLPELVSDFSHQLIRSSDWHMLIGILHKVHMNLNQSACERHGT